MQAVGTTPGAPTPEGWGALGDGEQDLWQPSETPLFPGLSSDLLLVPNGG